MAIYSLALSKREKILDGDFAILRYVAVSTKKEVSLCEVPAAGKEEFPAAPTTTKVPIGEAVASTMAPAAAKD